MNELAHAFSTDYTSLALGRINCQYSKCTQTCIFKNHTNLFTNFTNRSLYTSENGFQGGLFPASLLYTCGSKNWQNGLLLKYSYAY